MTPSFCKFFGGASSDPLLPYGTLNLELGSPNMLMNHVVEQYAKVSTVYPVTKKNVVSIYNMDEIIYLCSQILSNWLFSCNYQYSPWLKYYFLEKLYSYIARHYYARWSCLDYHGFIHEHMNRLLITKTIHIALLFWSSLIEPIHEVQLHDIPMFWLRTNCIYNSKCKCSTPAGKRKLNRLQYKHLSITWTSKYLCRSGYLNWSQLYLELIREWCYVNFYLLYPIYTKETTDLTVLIKNRYTSHCIFLWCRNIGYGWNDTNWDWLMPCPASFDACHRLLSLCQLLNSKKLRFTSCWTQLYRSINDYAIQAPFWSLTVYVILNTIKYWKSIIMYYHLKHNYITMYIADLANQTALAKHVQFASQQVSSLTNKNLHKVKYLDRKASNRAANLLCNRMVTELNTWTGRKIINLLTAYKKPRHGININDAQSTNRIDKQCIRIQHKP